MTPPDGAGPGPPAATTATRDRRAVAALCALALAVRLYALGRPSLWFDEALEVERATGPWRALWLGRPIDHDPPLWALALRGWIAVGRGLGWPWLGVEGGAARDGWAEAWLRLPSVALGVAAVALTAVWAGRHLGKRIGRCAGLLLAVAPLAIHASQEVNQYAAMVAATPLLLLAVDRLAAAPAPAPRRAWLGYGALSAAALATHYGLVFPLLALGAGLAWRAWRRPAHRADRAPVAAYALAMAGMVAALFALGLGDRLAVPHVQPRLWGTHLAKELAYIGDTGWREIVVYFPFPFAGGPALALANALGVAAAVGAARLGRRGGAGRGLVALVAATLALTYATSLVGWYPLGYRYGLFNLAPYAVLAAAGLDALARPARNAAVATTVLAFAAFWPHAPWSTDHPFLHVPREDVRLAMRAAAGLAQSDEPWLATAGAGPAARFYASGRGRDVVALPPLAPGDAAAADRLGAAVQAAIATDRAGATAGGRAWLVVARLEAGGDAALRAALDARGIRGTVAAAADGAAVWRLEARGAGR